MKNTTEPSVRCDSSSKIRVRERIVGANALFVAVASAIFDFPNLPCPAPAEGFSHRCQLTASSIARGFPSERNLRSAANSFRQIREQKGALLLLFDQPGTVGDDVFTDNAAKSSSSTAEVHTPKHAEEGKIFTRDEIEQIRTLFRVARQGDDQPKDNDASSALLDRVREELPSLSPSLLAKLRLVHVAGADASNGTGGGAGLEKEDEDWAAVRTVSAAVESVLEQQLESGARLLEQLLNAGEIRRLDSLIGKAGREQRLDTAFFQVLQMNLQDAMRAPQTAARPSTESQDDTTDAASDIVPSTDAASNRYQILTHIYTRCQEEVEKSLPPGMALVNKLIRTADPSIRSNIIKHYLTPAPTTITSPDGRTITLSPTGGASSSSSSPPSLVSIDELIHAVTTFVGQVRVVEREQLLTGTDSSSTVAMIESTRLLCKEILGIVLEASGPESGPVRSLKEGLQPVFRPGEEV